MKKLSILVLSSVLAMVVTMPTFGGMMGGGMGMMGGGMGMMGSMNMMGTAGVNSVNASNAVMNSSMGMGMMGMRSASNAVAASANQNTVRATQVMPMGRSRIATNMRMGGRR